VKEIISINRKGKKVDRLKPVDTAGETAPLSQDLLKNNSLTRFDPPEKKNQPQRNQNRRKNRKFNDKKNN